MKNVALLIIALILSGCGAYEEKTAGLEEDTLLILRGESLVGLSVEITPNFVRLIRENDLTKYTMGMAGVTNSENQNLQTLTLKVEPGNQRLTIRRDGTAVYERDLQLISGQTRELRIRL